MFLSLSLTPLLPDLFFNVFTLFCSGRYYLWCCAECRAWGRSPAALCAYVPFCVRACLVYLATKSKTQSSFPHVNHISFTSGMSACVYVCMCVYALKAACSRPAMMMESCTHCLIGVLLLSLCTCKSSLAGSVVARLFPLFRYRGTFFSQCSATNAAPSPLRHLFCSPCSSANLLLLFLSFSLSFFSYSTYAMDSALSLNDNAFHATLNATEVLKGKKAVSLDVYWVYWCARVYCAAVL